MCPERQLKRLRLKWLSGLESEVSECPAMAVGLASLLQGIVVMLSSVWTVLPLALVVAFSTWLWFQRGKNQKALESPEGAGPKSTSPEGSDRSLGESSSEDGEREGCQQDTADKITVSESDNMPEIKTAELNVSTQQSPVDQKTVALEAQDIPDAVVKIQESAQDQNLSNKQDPADSSQKNICENNQTKNNSMVGQVTVHNASMAEDCNFSKEEMYVCETKCTDKSGNMYEKFDHKDEASDQMLKPDKINGTGYLKEAPDTNICKNDIDMSNKLECLKTEEEKDKKFFQEHVNAESERMNASSEPENIARKVAAVSPLPLNIVSVNFNVHYITYLNSQILAVTGNHECLGQWERYVPLKPNKDGFWSSSILLPVNSKIEWKFVVVEDGKICRWEECFNRMLETGHEDFEVYQCWGYH
ncbi:starch-binding domain-containing protein 1 [Rhincodon typus]|uniref:starch-binding domain-containing protein 1 n=1 Tax=Rhincodon typus TaxID=259920 RepID=UPI00202ED2FE|nr:starch-binding domain-containing protein 1 [Rhincodon typus]